MSIWLYQINGEKYSHEQYNIEVWEGKLVTGWTIGTSTIGPLKTEWTIGTSITRPKEGVRPGDTVILFRVEAGTRGSGIYGWGIITSLHDELIDFRPTSPSDYLKTNPLPEKEVGETIRKIQVRFPQVTMFKVNDKDFAKLRQKIESHVYGINSES